FSHTYIICAYCPLRVIRSSSAISFSVTKMQGGRSILDSLTETIDLNQGLVPSSSSMDRSSPWDNILDPAGSRFSNSVPAASEGYAGSPSAPSFSGWDQGESSSAADLNGRVYCSDLKAGHMWPSSSSNYAVADQGSEERGFESSNVFANKSFSSSYGGNHPISRPSTHHFNSNHSPGNDGHLVTRTGAPSNVYKFGGSEAEHIPALAASSDNTGTSYNSGYMVGNQDVSGSSWGTWGLSGKRKTLEGSSRQLSVGGSSSSNPRAEDIVLHNVPACYNSSGSLGISSPSNPVDFTEQRNSRNGHGSRFGVADGFPPLSVNSVVESSRAIGSWANIRNQESVSFGLPPIGAAMGHSTVSSIDMPPRPISINDSSEMRQPLSAPLNPSHTASQSQSMQGPSFPRGRHSFPWNGSHDSQGGGSSGSNMVSGGRGGRSGIFRGETRFRSSLRNNAENRRLNSATEARNFVQNTTNWNADIPSGSGIGSGSLMQASHTPWVPNQNLTSSSHQRLSEFSPWTLFPPAELESASRRGHISSLHSATTSEGPSRRANRHSRPYNRSSMMVDVPGDDHSGWRALAGDIDGRHRMATEQQIRQVLNAMRRVENLHAEDYMMYEPFINGVGEFHDRHRDMRLDVDNMSYEELLALEERIGNVNTGLSEESILKVLKQRKYESKRCGGLSSDLEPCCICQEEYVSEDEIGIMECGHEFHMNCVKQWLMEKNLCPICKVTALNS
ncbi:PREDICTED: E3 ubiquitin-protein ligase MBR1-like, partial [Ipomoea nil]|uniref:E3 ubiquitin-protein ligase MBR1-like n=1 Tax=Ipomoea nil TaxID=35883 RepID=UPI00090103F0